MMPPAEDFAVLSPRAALAARLTRALLRTPAAGACVIALCGAPVSGKTWLAARVVDRLLDPGVAGNSAAADTDTAAGNRPAAFYAQAAAGPSAPPANVDVPLIAHFNPAYHATRRQLMEQFFRTLSVVLKRDRAASWQRIGALLDAYAALLSPLSLLLPALREVPLLQRLLRGSAQAVDKFAALEGEEFHALRTKLENELRAAGRRVIIVMDDLDRLQRTEIRQVFQLITRVGDFPNLAYLLVFDPQPVRQALARVADGTGVDPLEHYVHFAVQVPPLTPRELQATLHERLRDACGYTPPGQSQAGATRDAELQYEQRVLDLIYPLFTELRDVTRFANALNFAAGMLRPDEVRPIDCIAATALRVFEPSLYAAVREHKALFVSASATPPVARPVEHFERILALAHHLDQERCAALLAAMFPRVAALLPNRPSAEQRPCRPRDACDPRAFDACFSPAPPPPSPPG